MIPIGESRLERLEELRRNASLTRLTAPDLGPFRTHDEAAAYIKDALRLYLQTWVLPVIDRLIDDERARRERLKAAKGQGRLAQ